MTTPDRSKSAITVSEATRRHRACLDCKVDTVDAGEYYIVRNDVWLAANPGDDGMICIGCLEKRLGRKLTPADFPRNIPLNEPSRTHSERLSDRLGHRTSDDDDRRYRRTHYGYSRDN